MKALFKKYFWIVALLFAVGGLASIGFNFLKDIFFQKGLEAGKAEYQQLVDEAKIKEAEATKKKNEFSEAAGRDRETLRANAEKKMAEMNKVYEVFRSKTAAELKKKKATIEKVLIEKENDEIVIVEQKETIAYLFEFGQGVLVAWRISDGNIEAATQEVFTAKDIQIVGCNEWSAKLEKRLKRPKFLTYVKDVLVIGGAFYLGTRVGK